MVMSGRGRARGGHTSDCEFSVYSYRTLRTVLTLGWTLVLPRCSPGDITVSYEGRRDVTEQRRQPDTSRGELGHTGNQFWELVVWSAMTQT